MSSVSAIGGTTASAYIAPVTVAPAISAATDTSASTATANSATTASTTTNSDASLTTPARILSDPLSGIQVQQYLNSQNVVETQFPSKTVIAYLQNGLSADGSQKAEHAEHVA